MSQPQAVFILLLNVFLTTFVCAQYGRPAGNSNPGYGGTGTSVQSGYYGPKGQYPGSTGNNAPSGYYGPKGQYPVGGPGGSDGNSEPEPFNFAYQVKDAPTNTYFMHEANSDGNRVTGSYSVLLPDGRNQVVTYVADENGYNAKISYEGEAKPQPSQPGSQGGYPSTSGFLSTAPKYPAAPIRGSAPRPTGYPGSAVPASAPAPGYSSSSPAFGSSASAPASGPSSAPSLVKY
ncbi:pro-resilin-like [Metopolophium dirhodum]|uniref:pro-resilin-like n=1 Tax=Metopolophium dirhodum TaxID=44670 RepID=UPI00299014C4|nr:pro-resilin-like [Metopolophium dirhodum]